MSIFSLFKKKLSPKWAFKKDGFIWKALFLDSGFIAIEHRAKSERKTTFLLLDAETGKAIWQDYTLLVPNGPKKGEPIGEGWWVGLEAVKGELIYLHSYFNPSSPEHLGIWAMQARTKELKWALPDFSFLCFTQGKMMAYRESGDAEGFADRNFFMINPETGEIVESLGKDSLITNRIREDAESEAEMQGVELPVPCAPEAKQYQDILSVLKPYMSDKPITGGFELLRSSGKLFFGYHEQTERTVVTQVGLPVKALNYRLKVLDEASEKIQFDDIISTLMSGFLVDGFFVRKGVLYFVRERDTVCAYPLE
ncbi:MAG: DUF4905 domain-containing protein [Chloroherpetonaceae bacterium]|nr:DUF4905 domain-containing protein [Chloroherpetonaceae bacterium]